MRINEPETTCLMLRPRSLLEAGRRVRMGLAYRAALSAASLLLQSPGVEEAQKASRANKTRLLRPSERPLTWRPIIRQTRPGTNGLHKLSCSCHERGLLLIARGALPS